MESVVTRAPSPWSRGLNRLDPNTLSIWALGGGVILYLAIDGGGYDPIVHGQVGVIVWWIVLVGAALGLLPAARLSRTAWTALVLFGGFVAWTALATTWSQSSERSLLTLSLVVGYLGVLVLAIGLHRDRARAVRHTIAAIATAIVIVGGLALLARLRPDLFPSSQQTAAYLPGTHSRLGWPLNYWNALAALIALGLPLLFAIATSARTLFAQAAAAAAVPALVLSAYLTFSRGGAIAITAALIVFVALAPDRIPKLATGLLGAAGGAALIAGAVHRGAIEQGVVSVTARDQGNSLLLAVILVVAGVAVAQVGIGLAVRHGSPPRLLVIPPRRARTVLAGAVAVGLVVFLIAGGPTLVSHGWRDFKRDSQPSLYDRSPARFGVLSGNGRYSLWKVGVNATGGHLLDGAGPGTFQLTWLPRAPRYVYVQNAHSLYVETLSEVGVVGLTLLVGFFAFVVGAVVRLVIRTRHEERTRAAAVAAAIVAFIVSAASDWIWQVPALPAAFMLLAATALAPKTLRADPQRDSAAPPAVRAVAISLALACLISIAVPLATTSAIRQSQAAVASGDPVRALRDARQAARLEPGAAAAQIQLALVLELQGDKSAALLAARHATANEPLDWSAWLVASRLEAENGHPAASLLAYRRARSLNPRSPLFHA